MVKSVRDEGFLKLLLRGSLGGAFGGFLWALVAVLTSIGLRQGWWYWLLLGLLYQGLPLGLIIGAIVATPLWLVGRLTQLSLGLFVRFLLGALVATMIAWITAWWSTEQGNFFPTPWHLDFLWIVFFGAATGGVAGIMTGIQRRRRPGNMEEAEVHGKSSEPEEGLI